MGRSACAKSVGRLAIIESSGEECLSLYYLNYELSGLATYLFRPVGKGRAERGGKEEGHR